MDRGLLLLGLLLEGQMHGYQLNEYLEHAMGFFTDLKKPTAYYALNRLEREGHVRHETEREGKRPERRVYQLTEKGRASFYELLRSRLSEFSRTYYDDDIAVAFMDRLPAAEVRQLLLEKRDKAEGILDQLRHLPQHAGSARHVVRHNIAHLETELAWLDGMLEEYGDADA
jgi:DNA-binding PadR family transcriptional regulator